ncbi:hypothetical protein FIBSPDRAFT_287393 [Athelia psychrophila]|uniref:Uncharacterized protein n=1 Tax=Athelia psychrophila TaxID=1759441 RepID=A0A167XN05_9AGAM|nr:hypothetical protein FIBSPDRAFT_287393 [Fibularhizoctonia sp. CBS 109695]
MLPRDKRTRPASDEVDGAQRKQLRLQDDRENIRNRKTSTAMQTANTTSFNTTGTLGPVTNVAGHIFYGNVNIYNKASATSSGSSVPPPSQPSITKLSSTCYVHLGFGKRWQSC